MELKQFFGLCTICPGKPQPNGRRGHCLSLTSLLALTTASWGAVSAQVLHKIDDKFNVQVHGYATQGFLYSTQNNIYTTRSSDGSFRWADAVVSVGAMPVPRLRVGAQIRYFRFGKYSDSVSLDWLQADYKINDHFGIRAGKVKTPSGLFNEVQDIDPAYTWSLLPQCIYAVYNRSVILTHDGGIVYGSVRLGERFGKLDYRGWLGNQTLGTSDDGSFVGFREQGLYLPNGFSGAVSGAALRWNTPVPGLMVGASDLKNESRSGRITTSQGVPIGFISVAPYNIPQYFAKYERGKVLAATEYAHVGITPTLTLTGAPPLKINNHNWYGMASYKATSKLTGGVYYSQSVNHAASPTAGAMRFSKDWVLAGRYDFNQYIYAKAEQHFIDGTAIGYDTDLNPNGLKPDTRLTILKIGFSF